MSSARSILAGLALGALALAACSRTGLELGFPGAGGDGADSSGWQVTALRPSGLTKVDLLLTLDNSISMADKQALLAEAVPLLVQRLITAGSLLEPVSDVHVGVITSSLGSHGATGPRDVCVDAEEDDHAHLLGQLRGLPGTWRNQGFLAWDPRHEQRPPGDDDVAVFADKLRKQVQEAGEHGCGFEATLEAWYRFLIDPEPPLRIVVTGGRAAPEGVDTLILEQRAAFLRPDSLVAIIMLSDENDCSLQDEGPAWLIARGQPMFRSTSACANSPNDPCCQSCAAVGASGCPDPDTDSECIRGSLDSAADDVNLRCWQQKRRFGFDFLYSTRRYSDALRLPLVPSRAGGKSLQNPLFAAPAGALARDPSLIYLAGIVGVPWQDIADPQSLTGPGLRYLTAAELQDLDRWDVILGDPAASSPRPPSDPFMLETPEDRSTLAVPQTNPILPEIKLVPASSRDPQANVINGHEQVNLAGTDLQYACTFPLEAARSCDQAAADANRGCDCYVEERQANRSICQPPGMGPADTTQRYAKAYPGLRHLQVLKDVGEAGIVASICPKVLNKTSPDYGYNPAVEALVERVASSVSRRCLGHELPLDQDGLVPCQVVQAFPSPADGCACEARGLREVVEPTLADAVQRKLRGLAQCGSADPNCATLCRCELPQLTDAELGVCQNAAVAPDLTGFCYISAADGEPNVGNPGLLNDCPAAQRRDVRLLGGAPKAQLLTLLACPSD